MTSIQEYGKGTGTPSQKLQKKKDQKIEGNNERKDKDMNSQSNLKDVNFIMFESTY